MDERFEPAVVLHAVGRAVPDDADMIAGVERAGLRGGGRGGREEEECAKEGAHESNVLVYHRVPCPRLCVGMDLLRSKTCPPKVVGMAPNIRPDPPEVGG